MESAGIGAYMDAAFGGRGTKTRLQPAGDYGGRLQIP